MLTSILSPAPEFLLAWLMVMFPLVFSPGPANTLFASSGAQFGFRRSLGFMGGIDIAFVLQSLLVGLGLSQVLTAVPQLLTGFRILGILYIAYLGVVFLRAAMLEVKQQPKPLTFSDGMLVTALNPKAWVMQMMMFSQFFDAENAIGSTLQLTLWLAVLNVIGHVVWILLGSQVLSRATASLSTKRQNLIFSLMMFGSIWFLV